MNKEKQIDEIAKLICSYPQCMNYNKIGGCKVEVCRIADAAENVYNQGYRKQKWISVDERLPENEQMVLTIDNEGEMQVCFYETAWEGIFKQFHGLVKIYNITHWMPLPQPPETKGETE